MSNEADLEKIILCDCSDMEHIMRFRYFTEDYSVPYLSCIDFHLSKLPLIKRIAYAIKYIFGYQSKYGAFGEMVLNEKSALQIIEFLTESIKMHNENN